MKAFGSGLGAFALTDVEVERAPGEGSLAGAPTLLLHGGAAELAERLQAGQLHLSLTHTSEVAIAFVVAERLRSCSPS
jgi:holo-[acyl-carrier protein] synthase